MIDSCDMFVTSLECNRLDSQQNGKWLENGSMWVQCCSVGGGPVSKSRNKNGMSIDSRGSMAR